MSNQNHSQSGGFRAAAYLIFLTILVLKVVRSVLRTIVKTVVDIQDTRRYNRA